MSEPLTLAFRPPLDAGALLEHFRRRAVPGVEEIVDDRYQRSLRLPDGPATVSLQLSSASVTATFDLSRATDLEAADALCRALLGLDADPAIVAAAFDRDPLLGPAARAAPGRRVPGTADGAELAVRAVLGQQISLAGAATAAGRLVAECGERLARPLGPVTHLFPTPAALAAVDPARFRMPRSRARTLHALTAALASGEISLARGGDRERVRVQLLALPGIGPWTADYVVMRALGATDVFLPTDLGIRRALDARGLPSDPAGAAALAERWRPYRSYAMQYLWAMPDRG